MLGNLAEVRHCQGQLAEAEELCEQALAIQEHQLGQDHADVGTTLCTLAAVRKAQGAADIADALYQRAFDIRTRAGLPDLPSMADGLEDYADLLVRMNRPEEAAGYRDRAAAARATILEA
jgi:tetratricopeptide (TPR) repeat protein